MTERKENQADLARYQRQIIFEPLGLSGQRNLSAARALIVGVGGLGSWSADLLARAGVGFLRLVDDDLVDETNLHRQGLYDESDATAHRAKVTAAKRRIGQINRTVQVEAIVARADKDNIESLCEGIDLILDGTDNFTTRFLINDVSVKRRLPWVSAGVVTTEAQTMTFVPGRTGCLRCVLDTPPPPCSDPACRTAGALGPAVAAIAAIQAGEAIKILSGRVDQISPHLMKFDFWSNTVQRIDLAASGPNKDCSCCGHGQFEFMEP